MSQSSLAPSQAVVPKEDKIFLKKIKERIFLSQVKATIAIQEIEKELQKR